MGCRKHQKFPDEQLVYSAKSLLTHTGRILKSYPHTKLSHYLTLGTAQVNSPALFRFLGEENCRNCAVRWKYDGDRALFLGKTEEKLRALRARWTFSGSSDKIDLAGKTDEITPPEGTNHDEENNQADTDCGADNSAALRMLLSAGEHGDAVGSGSGTGEHHGGDHPWPLVFQGY